MSQLSVTSIQSLTASTPPLIKDSAGVEVGTFCRAWVNFNGTGTVAIRADFNCSSVTDNGVGDYTVNFSTAMVDANFAAVASTPLSNGFTSVMPALPTLTTSVQLRIGQGAPGTVSYIDPTAVYAAIFR